MNLSRAITSIKMQLGLYNITLPFKDEITGKPIPTENVIRDVLVTTTIPIYSQFQPWLREGDADLKSLKLVDKKNNIYMLPAYLTMTPVMYIADVHMPFRSNTGGYGYASPSGGLGRSAQAVIMGQAANMLTGEMRAEPTFEYLGENKVRLYGFAKSSVTFRLACEHEPNGETIPEGCYESFMQLAMLDTKMFLYNTLKMYDNIATAFGNIQLKSEDNQGAEADRTALLEKWNDTFHLDMSWETFM